MIWKNRRASGMVSTEVAISIGLTVAVLFIVLGLFSDNLKAMVTQSNIKSFFEGNDSKTFYSSFNRNYSNSVVETQMVGEQGLEQMRKRANNKAIEKIESPFSDSNANANTIGYLAIAIQSMVGEPHVCTYMKKNSKKVCDKIDPEIGYQYKIKFNGDGVTINSVDASGNSVSKTIRLYYTESTVASLLGGGTSQGSTDEAQYDFIKGLTISLKPFVDSDALLINVIDYFTSTIKAMESTTNSVSNAISDAVSAAEKAYNACHGNIIKDADSKADSLCYNCESNSWFGADCAPTINKSDLEEIKNLAKNLNALVNSYNGNNPNEMLSEFINNNDIVAIMENLDDDAVNQNPSSCETFANGLYSAAAALGTTITLPQCKDPNKWGE